MFPHHEPPAIHAEAALRDQARAQLSREGLLDRLPSFEGAHGNLAAFARAVESFSGFAPGSMLEASDGEIRIAPKGGAQFAFDQLERLTTVLLAALPQDSGIRIVLIASER